MNTNIEVVLSFDTTGSMYPCIGQVRREAEKLTKQLFADIPNFRMGVIAHGDYCDAGKTYITKELPLTTSIHDVCDFIRNCGNTWGGDAAECYELVLHKARAFQWTAGKSKVLVLMGDDVPHGANEAQNTLHLDWRNELGCLLEMGVKVYAVQCLNRGHASAFYREIAVKTGGFHLALNQFSEITDIINGICYQQEGPEAFQQYQEQVQKAGRMTRSSLYNFGVLSGKSYADAEASVGSTYGVVTDDLQIVPPGRFQVMYVPNDIAIADFVRNNGLTFRQGRGFYEFTKSVMVQHYKEVVLQDKTSGDMYTGNKARQIMGIPIGVDAQVYPNRLGKYRCFIQSTSNNRKLIGGTNFLYEVD